MLAPTLTAVFLMILFLFERLVMGTGGISYSVAQVYVSELDQVCGR